MNALIRSILIATLFSIPVTGFGQVSIDAEDFAFGLGFFSAEEGEADAGVPFSENDELDVSRAFASIQWYGIKGLGITDASGFGIDLATADGKEGLVYRIWSLHRKEIAVGIYAGTDLKIASGGASDKWAGDFDVRGVTGYKFNLGEKYRLAAEVYAFEEDSQVAFAVIFSWE